MMSLSADPRLSVIVICINHTSMLERCLAALTADVESYDAEILAVGRWDGQRDDLGLRARYPQVRWIAVANEFTVPLVRTHGIAQSRGAIIALLEDDCVVADGWCEGIFDAHRSSFDAIGGPIEPGDRYKNLDWAVYFCEYSRFMPPFAGVVSALPGNNVTYKRTVLSQVQKDGGFYDVLFHWQLQQSGKALFASPKLVVYNVNRWSLAHVTTSPFHHGRAFAGRRARDFSRWRRWLFASLAIALPLIKVARVAREVMRRRRYVKEFFLSLPWTFLFMLSWSCGEFLGYGFGAGDSASRWR